MADTPHLLHAEYAGLCLHVRLRHGDGLHRRGAPHRLLRRRTLHLTQLYAPPGTHSLYSCAEVNWRAFLAVAAGVGPGLPGFCASLSSSGSYGVVFGFVYSVSFIFALLVSSATFWLATWASPPRGFARLPGVLRVGYDTREGVREGSLEGGVVREDAWEGGGARENLLAAASSICTSSMELSVKSYLPEKEAPLPEPAEQPGAPLLADEAAWRHRHGTAAAVGAGCSSRVLC